MRRALSLFGILSVLSQAHAGNLQLKVELEKEREVSGKSSLHRKYEHTQLLKISVMNIGVVEMSDLRIVHYFFARYWPEKTLILVKKGEKTVTLAPRASDKCEVEGVELKYRGPSIKDDKPVPPQGHKFAGYGVQVFSGDQVLAELFEPTTLKENINLTVTPPYVKGKKKQK